MNEHPLGARARSPATSLTYAIKQKKKTIYRRKIVNEERTILPWTPRPPARSDVYG
jgi:hypothetical protein